MGVERRCICRPNYWQPVDTPTQRPSSVVSWPMSDGTEVGHPYFIV